MERADPSPDLLLLDMMMPGMDGMELCRIIKENKLWQHIPIILVTALDSKEDLRRGLLAGADDFLSKPVSGIELRARVRSMLRIKSQYDTLQNILTLREELANMVVHDMRSPICAILGYSDFLRRNLSDPRDLEDVEKIRKEAKRINLYLSDLLLMAKMESEKLIINRGEIPVPDLVDKVIRNHAVLAEVRNITLRGDIPGDVPALFADGNLALKVLNNLVSNAIKYTDDDSEIVVRAARAVDSSRGGGGVLFAVEDQGPGIPEEYREAVFDKFKVIENENQGMRQIGLGLAFCKLAVEAHGGTITLEDNTPHGSRFLVQF
ncbi:response regulator [bacterium]|nr:response regulator [bacterium]